MPLPQPSVSFFAGFCSRPLHLRAASCRHGHIISAATGRPQVSGSQPSEINSSDHELDSNAGYGHGSNNGGGGSGTSETAAAGPDPAGNRNWAKVAILVLKVLTGIAIGLFIIVAAGPSIVSTGPGLAVTLALVNLLLPGSIHVDKVLPLPLKDGEFFGQYLILL